MKTIKLRNSDKIVMLDNGDFSVLRFYPWRLSAQGYITRGVVENGVYKSLLLHRLIANAKDGDIVDHINGDRLDNRVSNLRLVSAGQNAANKGMMSNNTSGIKGIRQRASKWRAEIGFNRKTIYIGTFGTVDEAVAARKEAEQKYFGEYARA